MLSEHRRKRGSYGTRARCDRGSIPRRQATNGVELQHPTGDRALISMGVATPESTVPAKTRTREVGCDLLVIGSGAAGLSAAVTAAWHGLKVIVVEKDSVCGGATA